MTLSTRTYISVSFWIKYDLPGSRLIIQAEVIRHSLRNNKMDAVAIPSEPPDPPWNERLERLNRNLNQYVRYELGEDNWARWPDIRKQKRFQSIHYEELKCVLLHAKREGLCRYEFIETRKDEEEPTCEFRTRFMEPLPRGSKHNGKRGNKRQRDNGVTTKNTRFRGRWHREHQRVARDDKAYTYQEFREWYGEHADSEWHVAEPYICPGPLTTENAASERAATPPKNRMHVTTAVAGNMYDACDCDPCASDGDELFPEACHHGHHCGECLARKTGMWADCCTFGKKGECETKKLCRSVARDRS